MARLTRKKVGGAVNASELQKVDYEYNIRGWLTDINTVENLQDDLFSMRIHYENNGTGTDLFNGNISKISSRTANLDNTIKEYNYNYDALNRLTSATHNTGNYNLGNVSYDKNGNILRLQRLGLLSDTGSTYGVIDDLSYTYLNNGQSNRLSKVVDGSANTMGFSDGSNTNADYTYDADGNMKRDRNKNITQNIGYNHLNLPTVVKFGSGSTNRVNYYYDALGTKYRKQVREGNTVTGTTNYAGGAIYKGNTLEFMSHPEGYTMPNDASDYVQGFAYVYNYSDHLGNTRLSYTDGNGDGIVTQNEIVKESNYYPYGLQHKGYNGNVSALGNTTAKKYMFGGMEYNEELGLDWYDITARNYDPALGRWMNIDPLADQMRRHSPYNYAFDNPIYFIDPDGMAPFSTNVVKNEDGTHTVTGKGNASADDGDNNIYVVDENGNRTGEVVGESLTSHSFYFDDGTAVEGAVIDVNSTEGQEFVDKVIEENPSLAEYMPNAVGEQKYDHKTDGIEDRKKGTTPEQYKYRGSKASNGKIGSARDFGNGAAGIVAGRKGIPYFAARIAFDALEGAQKNDGKLFVPGEGLGGSADMISTSTLEGKPTRLAQKIGHKVGRNIKMNEKVKASQARAKRKKRR